MSGALVTVSFQLPSVDRFFAGLLDELAGRRSLVVAVPRGIDTLAISTRLQDHLWQKDFGVQSVSLDPSQDMSTPAAVVGDALGVEWPSPDAPRSAETLSLSRGLPEVLWLEGFARLPGAKQQAWLSWLSDWARASQNAADRGDPTMAVLLLAPAEALLPQVPESGPRLAVHWWWGFPSTLEMRLLCRLCGGDSELDSRSLWREHVLSALVGNNIALAAHLWDDLYQDPDHLVTRLLDFAAALGWNKEELEAGGAERLAAFPRATRSRPSSPPPRWRELWARGAANWTPERGLELDTAALAALGRKDEVMHRLWRGQASLVLPLIDQTRLGLCDRLTDQFGSDWALRWASPESPDEEEQVRQSPRACSWGYLQYLLRNHLPLHSARAWLPLSSIARRARNELAHYHPLAFSEFEGLWKEIERTTSLRRARA